MKYAWIDQAREHFPLKPMCTVLGVSPSGYASWKRGGRIKKRLTDAQLLTLIRAIHCEVKGRYGWPRVWEELRDRGIPAGKERVRKLMKAHGIRARHKRKYKATTDSKHNLPVALNLLNRHFATDRPDQVWNTDITFIPTGEGWLYLAAVLDLHTRIIVGWAMRSTMTRQLVIDALRTPLTINNCSTITVCSPQ